MNILIIRFSSMGDVICVSPLLSFLKTAVPAAQLTLVTGDAYTGLFRDDPRLASVTAFCRDRQEGIFADLAAHTWHRIIDLQNNRRSRYLRKKYFPGVPCGVFDKRHMQRAILLVLRLNLYGTAGSVARRYIRASGLSLAPADEVPPVKLFFTDDTAGARSLFNGGEPVLALFPFSAWKNKQWPRAAYAAVGRHFAAQNWRIALFGGPGDIAEAAVLQKEIGDACYSFAGAVSLYEAGCMIKRCSLALGNDTGLSHLARACGVTTGIVYGATTRHFGFFPYGEPSHAVFEKKQFCRPCHAHGGNHCLRRRRPCLTAVTPERVIKGLETLRKVPLENAALP